MLWKCCTQYASKFGKLSCGHRTGKCQFSFQSQRKTMPKKCSDYCTIALISHTSKVMLKILQARFQQYVNWELPDVQAGVRKGRGTRDQIANIHWNIEKAREFQKNICFCFIDYTKAHHFMANRNRNVEAVRDFIFLSSKNHWMVTAAMKLKDACSLAGKLWPT